MALRDAGLATAEQVKRVLGELGEFRDESRVYHETHDYLLRDIHAMLSAWYESRETPKETQLPRNNFAEAGVVWNDDFVGRTEILDQLHRLLGGGDTALTHDLPRGVTEALTGEGGIGKTQIAVRYACEHQADYDGCWWLDGSEAAIDASTARLAATLRMPPGPQDTPEMI